MQFYIIRLHWNIVHRTGGTFSFSQQMVLLTFCWFSCCAILSLFISVSYYIIGLCDCYCKLRYYSRYPESARKRQHTTERFYWTDNWKKGHANRRFQQCINRRLWVGCKFETGSKSREHILKHAYISSNYAYLETSHDIYAPAQQQECQLVHCWNDHIQLTIDNTQSIKTKTMLVWTGLNPMADRIFQHGDICQKLI